MTNYFLPLGGANEVGASAYLVQVDGVRMLFDCGARLAGEEKYPDYQAMLAEVDEYNQIDYLFLSHAHYDHIGSFPYIACLASEAEIMATKTTKELTRLQLLDFGRITGAAESERIMREKYCRTEEAIERICEVPVMKPVKRQNCSITFYPAGHMTGACMILVETEHHKVLYTGDFSLRTMSGVNEFRMPEVEPDIVILNGVHAYHEHKKVCNNADKLVKLLHWKLNTGKNVYIHSQSIAKHLDLFYALQELPKVNICLSKESECIGDALSALGYHVFSENMKSSPQGLKGQHIMIGTKARQEGYEDVNFDLYSLHASHEDVQYLLKQWHGAKTYIVHTNPEKHGLKNLVADMNSMVVQAENKQVYHF